MAAMMPLLQLCGCANDADGDGYNDVNVVVGADGCSVNGKVASNDSNVII